MDQEMTLVPEAQPVEKPYVDSFQLTGDNAKDLAAIAKEQGLDVNVADITGDGKIVTAEQAQAPAQPAPKPQAAEQPSQPAQTVPNPVQQAEPQAQEPQPTEVPAKFKNPDGTVDEAKLGKSLSNVEDMIARCKAKEKEAQQLQNRVNNPQAFVQAPQQPQPFPQPMQAQQAQAAQYQQAPMLTPLEIQMAQDLIQESAQFGQPIPQAQAIALARVQARALAARYQADNDANQDLRRRVEDAERTRELQSLINSDPELMTEGMVDKLWQIRQDKPWLNQSAEPWKEAYIYYRGSNQHQSQGHAQQVQSPNPMRPTAPAAPVGPVSRVQPVVDVSNPKSLTDAQLEAEIRKIWPNFKGR